MLEPINDLEPARWLAEEAADFGGTVGELLPNGFDAYLRIFHRPDAGVEGLDCATSWAEVAQRHATVLHPEAQWTALTRGRDISPHRPDDPESPSDQPMYGSLDPVTLRALSRRLAEHTDSPRACHTALWDGTGRTPISWGRFPLFRRPGRTYWLFDPVPVEAVPRLSVEFEVLGMEEEIRDTGTLRTRLLQHRGVPTARSARSGPDSNDA